VIGGLITSTVPSLFYIPVVFTCVDDLKRRVGGMVRAPACGGTGGRRAVGRRGAAERTAKLRVTPWLPERPIRAGARRAVTGTLGLTGAFASRP
jgi:hypothetical protein